MFCWRQEMHTFPFLVSVSGIGIIVAVFVSFLCVLRFEWTCAGSAYAAYMSKQWSIGIGCSVNWRQLSLWVWTWQCTQSFQILSVRSSLLFTFLNESEEETFFEILSASHVLSDCNTWSAHCEQPTMVCELHDLQNHEMCIVTWEEMLFGQTNRPCFLGLSISSVDLEARTVDQKPCSANSQLWTRQLIHFL